MLPIQEVVAGISDMKNPGVQNAVARWLSLL